MQIMMKPVSVIFQGEAVFTKFLHNYRMSNYLCPLFRLIFPDIFFSSVFFKRTKTFHLYEMFIMTIYISNSKKFYLVLRRVGVVNCTSAECL